MDRKTRKFVAVSIQPEYDACEGPRQVFVACSAEVPPGEIENFIKDFIRNGSEDPCSEDLAGALKERYETFEQTASIEVCLDGEDIDGDDVKLEYDENRDAHSGPGI